MKSCAAIFLLGAFFGSGTFAAEELESFLAPAHPAHLEFVKAPPPHPALERYYGDPSSRNRVEGIRVAATDGVRVFVHPDHFRKRRLLEIWRIDDAKGRLKFEGDVGIGDSWRVSPDGKYLFGRLPFVERSDDHWSMYRMDTLEGLWKLDRGKCPTVAGMAFSPDGTSAAFLADLPGREAQLIVLDLQSGRTLKLIRIGGYQGDTNQEGLLLYTKDQILLAPACDEQGRITRVGLSDGKVEKVTLPKGGEDREPKSMTRLVCSPDGRWLVLRSLTSYLVLQHVGQDYTLEFEGEVGQPDSPGFVNPLETVAISPDSRQLVISGAGQHKVFDLASRKVVHADTTCCRCGIFSKDGNVFWRTCVPFQPIATNTWEVVKGWDPNGHIIRIDGLAFSPDGRWLLSCDEQRMLVWPVGAPSPSAECLSANKKPQFQSPSWSKDGSCIVGADGWDFLTWKWTSPAASGLIATIPGASLFGPINDAMNCPVNMHLVGNSSGTAFIAQKGKGSDVTSIRYPDRPGLVRHFKLPPSLRLRNIYAGQAYFSVDDEEVLFSFNGLHAYNVKTDALRSQTVRTTGHLAAHDPASRSMILRDDSSVTLVDDNTFQIKASIKAAPGTKFSNPQSNIFAQDPAVISADGHWLALCGALRKADDACLILVDLKQAVVSAVLPLELKEFCAAAFSPDSKKLALGHLNGSISQWDVAKLIATAPPGAIPADELVPKRKLANTAPNPLIPSKAPTSAPTPLPPKRWTAAALPRDPITLTHMNDSATWQAQPDGAIGAPDVLPYAGKLFVNDQAPSITAVRVAPPLYSLYSYDAEVEATALSGTIHIKRLLKVSQTGFGYLTDLIENVSSAPVEVDVDAEMCSPVPLNQLQDNKMQALSLKGIECTLSPDARAIWSFVPVAGTKAFFGVSFAVGKGAPMPRLSADTAAKKMRARYHLNLPPYDRRILSHDVIVVVGIKDSDARKYVYRVGAGNNFSDRWSHPAFMLHGANLAPPLSLVAPAALDAPVPAAESPIAGSYPKSVKKDGLGFHWTDALPPCGFGTELGCRSGLEVWLDGAPATFEQEREDSRTNRSRISNYEWSNVAETVQVLRREGVQVESGTFFQALEVENHADAPRHCRLELVTVLTGPVTAVLDANGRPLSLGVPIPSADYHGIVAIETAGANRPVTILALGKEGGVIAPPVLTLVNQRVFIARYDLTVGAREIIPLYHAATQRPLKAYPSFSDALVGWEPLRALPTKLSAPPKNWPSG